MIASARQALAFAEGKEGHGCEAHVPDDIDVRAIREKISLSQSEFARLFGLSKRTLEHWEHGRRVRKDSWEPRMPKRWWSGTRGPSSKGCPSLIARGRC